MIRAGIIGPTGYAGFHLIDILLRHPDAAIVYLGARKEDRPSIADIWPALQNRTDMRCALLHSDPEPQMDVAFVALPHTVAMDHVPALLKRGIRVVDISADYRLDTPEAYKQYYGKDHTDPENLGKAAYGLSELFRDEIAPAVLVANPGCYPTAVELALAPLLKNRLHLPGAPVIADAKSGLTGAGKTPRPDLHFPEANENVAAYKVGVHQHIGEMSRILALFAGDELDLVFVPHLIPMDRGILATCYLRLARPLDDASLTGIFRDFYAGHPFIRIRGPGVFPNTKQVTGTNYVDLAVRCVGDTAVILAAIDNLVKGAAGQAVQNMNIMFGLQQTAGLL